MAKEAKKAKRTLTEEHKAKLSAAAKRRHAKNRKDKAAQRKGSKGKALRPKELRITEIEAGIRRAQKAIKKLRKHRLTRLKVLDGLMAKLKALSG